MITITLKARTAQGFGGEDFYTEKVSIIKSKDALFAAKRRFAIKYNVDINNIETIKEN